MSAATVFSPVLAGLTPLPPRIAPRAGSIARPVRVTAAVLQSDGVATADIDEVLYYSSRAPLPAQLRPDATHLLPADTPAGRSESPTWAGTGRCPTSAR